MSRLKYIPTKKLAELLDHHATQGTTGADYGPVKHELEQILWERLERENVRIYDQYMADMAQHADQLETA